MHVSTYTIDLIKLLAARVNPLPPRVVEGFSSLHPIMRISTWFDRRADRRARVRLNATIDTGGDVQAATIIDMSSSGVGMQDVVGLRPGQNLVMAIDQLAPINAEVVWASGNRAGAKFIRAN